ncbi:hypothetical protein CCMSSC00406_0006362 [Pleurotus cornucopiae]|uniref:Uncharacterized protein n=1 Tax=Pleurotus cornucopiae TaxID=5321 RepID=A0ACB7IPW3_PLECO|nr:hypothetical protein CCMSSC00406_0006362 [Pleurotus cornucopiae]
MGFTFTSLCKINELEGILVIHHNDAALMKTIHLANVACGFHASDFSIMDKTVEFAKENGVLVGAHPSLPDRQGFGRREMDISPAELVSCFVYQVGALTGFLKRHDLPLNHIKPHGAIYGQASRSIELARAAVQVVKIFSTEEANGGQRVAFVGLAGTAHQQAAEEAGVKFIAEWFADLDYNPEGKLIITQKHDPVPHDVVETLLTEGLVTTNDGSKIPLGANITEVSICCHSDTPGAIEIATLVKSIVDVSTFLQGQDLIHTDQRQMLRRLPPEIWLSIFEHLQFPQRELAPMASISRYTKGIVETVLYREPSIGFSLQRKEISHLVEQFHRTVTRGDGRLADVVRTLYLGRFPPNTTGSTPGQIDTCLTGALLLSLRNLKYLTVLYQGVTIAPPTVNASCRFASITHLCWSTDVKDAISFASFLASMPSLEYVKVNGNGIGSIPLATDALSLLRFLSDSSLDFATTVLTGRHVPHLGLATENFEFLLQILASQIDATHLPMLKCVQSLLLTSNTLDPLSLMVYARLCPAIKYLQITSDEPIESLSSLLPFVDNLCGTKIEFLQLNIICDDNVESVKTLFSALPSLKMFDFARMNDDADSGLLRFRRGKLDDKPDWLEGESVRDWDQWWTDVDEDLENVKL